MKASIQKKIAKLHHLSMAHCDDAMAARAGRNESQATESFRQAFVLEREAAALIAASVDLEPTRSILHRSAASLALECGEPREAERLVATALGGDPPDEIAEELRDIFEQANLIRHLELKGLVLSSDEFQLSLTGKSVGYGMAESNEFVDRVQAYEKLLTRTIERLSGRPFREAGKAIKEHSRHAELFLSTPRAASFAVTFRLGVPNKQMMLPIVETEIYNDPEAIIDDLFNCLTCLERGDEEGLGELIPDATYRRNFTALAAKLSPDGDKVKMVGLTAVRHGEERKIALMKLPLNQTTRTTSKKETVVIVGDLLFANSTTSERKRIKIVDDSNIKHTIDVPDGMMADIVKPLWEERVIAACTKQGKALWLDHIHKLEDTIGEEPLKP